MVMNNKKLNVEFITENDSLDTSISNTLILQLMIQITQIGIRIDHIVNYDAMIEMEKKHGKDFSK